VTVRRWVGLFGFTLAEAAVLAAFFYGANPWIYNTETVLLSILMFVGLTVEHCLGFALASGLTRETVANAAEVSAIESVVWINWLVFAHGVVYPWSNATVALALVVPLLVVQHAIEDNISRGEPLFGRLSEGSVVGQSVIEALTATARWVIAVRDGMAALASAVLIAGLLVEHSVFLLRQDGAESATHDWIRPLSD
jgi:hypothetical protein